MGGGSNVVCSYTTVAHAFFDALGGHTRVRRGGLNSVFAVEELVLHVRLLNERRLRAGHFS
jgi:hypothetical protein